MKKKHFFFLNRIYFSNFDDIEMNHNIVMQKKNKKSKKRRNKKNLFAQKMMIIKTIIQRYQ